MIDGVACVFSQTEDEFVYWPSREQPMNCAAFTVTLINTDTLCLCDEEQIIIHDFILEATQVLHSLSNTNIYACSSESTLAVGHYIKLILFLFFLNRENTSQHKHLFKHEIWFINLYHSS